MSVDPTTSDDRITLLLRLAGPLQSWGISSRYATRDTGSEPSKSGVIGLVAAALGLPRDTDLSRTVIRDATGDALPPFDLTRLRFGVRVDNEGIPAYDFQTVGGGDDHPGIAQARDTPRSIARRLRDHAAGKTSNKGAISISNRYLLQDAVFLVGLEGDPADRAALEAIDLALTRPVFPIGLGRRGYVPSLPVAIRSRALRSGLREMALEDALHRETWPIDGRTVTPGSRLDRTTRLRIAIEPRADDADALRRSITRNDQPIAAAFTSRIFGPRAVVYDEIPRPEVVRAAPPDDIDQPAEEGAA